MSFIETPRMHDKVAFGFSGGPRFSTSVAVGFSGAEKRNVNWTQARGRWTATMLAKKQDVTESLIAHFRAVRGMAYGFRMKDWSDFECRAADSLLVELTANTTWQLYKNYTFGTNVSSRKIAKPRPNQVTIVGAGTYTVNTATGVVTKTGGSNPTGWYGAFDVPVRFDTDDLNIEIINRNRIDGLLYTWGNIPLVELKDTEL
jgi:uncharacterized protein (TIGR02217 family)